MARVVKSIRIDAPREHVFALATDITRQPDWTTFVKEGVITSGDGKSAGTTDRMVIQVGPRPTKAEHTWTEYNSRRAVCPARHEGHADGRAHDLHACWQRHRRSVGCNYTPPMGPIGAFMDVFMMNRVYQNEIEGSLERLKEALET